MKIVGKTIGILASTVLLDVLLFECNWNEPEKSELTKMHLFVSSSW